ncbi:phage N-6-adenine-methyltransferase [Testudinibacter sp. P80/BLE/0925]
MEFDKDTYQTPDEIYADLDAEFGITIDGCTDGTNAKCDRFITKEMDFLTYELSNEVVFINPPYSKPKPFVERAVDLFKNNNCTVIMVLPVDISTKWFKAIQENATEIRFIVGDRIAFYHPVTGERTKVSRGNMIAIFNQKQKNWGLVTRYIGIDDFEKVAA